MPNLRAGVSDAQVAHLLASVDDHAGNHMVWVDGAGQVHITKVVGVPAHFYKSLPGFKFRLETFVAGNSYAGAAAASDVEHVRRIREELETHWNDGSTGYVGN